MSGLANVQLPRPPAVCQLPVAGSASPGSQLPSPSWSPPTGVPAGAGARSGVASPSRYQRSRPLVLMVYAMSALPSPSKSYGTARCGAGVVVVVVVGGGGGGAVHAPNARTAAAGIATR